MYLIPERHHGDQTHLPHVSFLATVICHLPQCVHRNVREMHLYIKCIFLFDADEKDPSPPPDIGASVKDRSFPVCFLVSQPIWTDVNY